MKKSRYVLIGILVFLTIVILVWGVNFLKGKNFFKKETTFFVTYNNINQLEEASPVTFNGLKIGIVKEISLHPDNSGRIIVCFFLTNQNVIIKKPAIARIYSMDLMGSRGIDLISGNSEEFHINGDTLIGTMENDLVDKVSAEMLPIKRKAESLMASMDSVMAVIQYIFNKNNRENIAKSVESIKFTLKNLENTSVKIDTLVTEEANRLSNIFANIDTISMNVKGQSDRLKSIIKNVESITDTIAKIEINSVFNQTSTVLTEIQSIIARVNSGEGSLGKLIKNDSIYFALLNASDNLNSLIRDIRLNPKRYLHFSAVDLGKTIIVTDNEEGKLKQEENMKTEYSVLILSGTQSYSPDDPIFKGVSGIKEFQLDNVYYYLIGKHTKMNRIKKLFIKTKEVFPDAKIVSLNDGK
ncbi:MlaD family protein, partial [Bacteroidota bacterium]